MLGPASSMETQDWEKFGELKLTSGKLWLGDAHYAPERADGLLVDLPKGEYVASILFAKAKPDEIQWTGERPASFRVALSGCQPVTGKLIGETWSDRGSRVNGEVWSDFAIQGICDLEVFHAAMPNSDKKYWKLAEEKLVDFYVTSELVLDESSGAKLLIVSAGEDAGRFKLFELLADGLLCGVEVELLPKGELS